jgi:hypothetical protein
MAGKVIRLISLLGPRLVQCANRKNHFTPIYVYLSPKMTHISLQAAFFQ